ncbi:MAG: hypothetical protein A2879_00040 [Omnitrophica WOR_2 bacterium RIFCSPHIGHO2_01_FULL_49_10]|nr:MAG: hypothetical protein A2879_00040 [Omnitrophica WOR_2 bacterium RIFCSPHIGHO2_01_FULL_49_10]OGX33973.1 MAG: hypothetical protein A3I43_01605 [Omnitrophica WOR_2 bacterium RIFCSPLOWO2_02_FULL_50_19]
MLTKNDKNISANSKIAVILIVIFGFIVYANSFFNDFVYDDSFLVVKNSYIKSWQNLKEIFVSHIFEGSNRSGRFYRPLQSLSYVFDYSLWKLNPFGYHLTNTTLHILNAILAYFLINLLTKGRLISLVASILFVIHPVQTEAVTYISGRSDLLGAFFLLSSLLLYIRYASSKRKNLLIISLISFMLALLSREAAIIFPFILVLYNYYFIGKEKKIKLIPLLYFLIASIYILLRITVLEFHTTESNLSSLSLFTRLITSFKVFSSYLRLFIVPFGLHMERQVAVVKSFFEFQVILSTVLFFAILALILRSYKKERPISFGLSFYLLNLIPYSNIYPLNAFMADHWLYFPSIGFFMAISIALSKAVDSNLKKLISGFIILIIAFYSALTIKRNLDWKDPLTFYQNTLRYSPNSFKAHNNLASIYARQKLFDKAIEEYKKALQVNPYAQDTYFNLGNVYINKGMYNEAIDAYKKAIELNPKDAGAHNNLGIAYYLIKDYQNAKAHWKNTLKFDPNHEGAKDSLEQLRKSGY